MSFKKWIQHEIKFSSDSSGTFCCLPLSFFSTLLCWVLYAQNTWETSPYLLPLGDQTSMHWVCDCFWFLFPSPPSPDWDSAASAIWQVPVGCQGTKINLYLVSTVLNDRAGNRCTAARQPFLPYALSTLLHANRAICSLADLLFFLARPTKGGNSSSYLFLLQYLVMLGYNIISFAFLF